MIEVHKTLNEIEGELLQSTGIFKMGISKYKGVCQE